MPTLTLTNVTKQYEAGQPPAVDQIDMTVEEGSFTCILGPSGCGKSTLLRMIAGLERASAGRIAIDDRAVDDAGSGAFVPPEKRGVGLVFQSYALWPHMTVAQNIGFGLKLQNLSRGARKARVAEMVKTLRIEGLEQRYPAQLSGGQQQRVALARTLALSPNVLLLDEPLSNLDASLRLQMRAELSRLHREFGTTIVFVTHDQWEAMTLATHIAVVNKGQLQQMGAADEIYDRPVNRFVAEFIGNPPINLLEGGLPSAQALWSGGVMPASGPASVPTSGPASLLGAIPAGATLALRPEALDLNMDAQPRSAEACVTAIIPTGGAWIVEMQLVDCASPLLLTTHLRPCHQTGDRVFVSARAEGLSLFDLEGQRIDAPAFQTASPTEAQTARDHGRQTTFQAASQTAEHLEQPEEGRAQIPSAPLPV